MRAAKQGDEICIEDGYLYRESIKEIPGRRYDAESKGWYAPCTERNAALLQMLGAEIDESLDAFVSQVCETAEDEKPLLPMPIKAEPYKHQVRAFNFAMRLLGGADENDM